MIAETYLHDSDHRTESLFTHDFHRVINIDQDLRRNIGRSFLCFGEIGFGDERFSTLRDCGSGRRVRGQTGLGKEDEG